MQFARYDSVFPRTTDRVLDEAHSSIIGRATGRSVYEARDHLPYNTECYLNYFRFWQQFRDGLPPEAFIAERIAKLGGGNGDFERTIARISASENIEGTKLIVNFNYLKDNLPRTPEAFLEPLPANEPYWRKGESPVKLLNYMSEAALVLMTTSRALGEYKQQFGVKIDQVELRWAKDFWVFSDNPFKLDGSIIPGTQATPLANGDYLFGRRAVQS